MSRICILTSKKTRIGNHRSHAMNATKRRFYPNLHWHKFWFEEENRYIKLLLSAKAIKLIDKKGLRGLLNGKK